MWLGLLIAIGDSVQVLASPAHTSVSRNMQVVQCVFTAALLLPRACQGLSCPLNALACSATTSVGRIGYFSLRLGKELPALWSHIPTRATVSDTSYLKHNIDMRQAYHQAQKRGWQLDRPTVTVQRRWDAWVSPSWERMTPSQKQLGAL